MTIMMMNNEVTELLYCCANFDLRATSNDAQCNHTIPCYRLPVRVDLFLVGKMQTRLDWFCAIDSLVRDGDERPEPGPILYRR